MTATVTGTATSATLSPGWRLYYAADAFTHMGGISATTYASDGDGVHAPYDDGTAHPLDVHLYWAVPYELTEYGDGETLANFGSFHSFFDDARDYKIGWNRKSCRPLPKTEQGLQARARNSSNKLKRSFPSNNLTGRSSTKRSKHCVA